MKKLFKILLPISLIPAFVAVPTTSCSCNKSHSRLTRNDWEDKTKQALNDCISNYGIDGKHYSKDNYVVFDFDNTSAIFDIEHQCIVYQIEHMAFNLTKLELEQVLSATLGDTTRSLTSYGYDFTYKDLIDDITTNYQNLINKFGEFSYKGIDKTKLTALHADDDWIDFSAKLRYMYSVVSTVQGDKERCKWGTFKFTGMTPDQAYQVEYDCLRDCSVIDSREETWTSKTKISNSNTIAKATFIQGISVTDNIKELYKTINDNGLDIWIVSASQIDQVRAAADIFGLGQYVKGALALTNKLGTSGKYIPEYDTNGKGYIKKDGKWVMMDVSNPNFTSGVGKSLAIKDVIAPNYNNKGPIMCFGDSTGDFNFCSEFKDTKLVVCFNRADRGVDDGGGLMSAIAIYQLTMNLTLDKANANNDTLYCLQGRNENDKRSFINSNKTIKLGTTEEKLFKNSANYTLLEYIKTNSLSIKDACQLCIKTEIQGTKVGFLTEYIGYHTR